MLWGAVAAFLQGRQAGNAPGDLEEHDPREEGAVEIGRENARQGLRRVHDRWIGTRWGLLKRRSRASRVCEAFVRDALIVRSVREFALGCDPCGTSHV
jgi:hypothetical protein